MNSLKALFLFAIVYKTVNSQFFYEDVKMYGCRCLQKDQTNQLLSKLTNGIPVNANRPIWKSFSREQPTMTSNLQSKIHYLKQWLASLTLDSHTVPPTTTSRPTTTTEDPVSLPFDEAAAGNNVFLKLAYKMMAKYFKKFRGEWTILDRFECVCDGDLIELLKSKTFINIQIAHD